MNPIKLILILFFGFLLNSCSTNTNKIFWVSGIKTECSTGVEKTQCLNVYKGENLDNATWENFYAQIEGFEFEEGVMKKLEIKEEKIENPTADGSSIKYTMIKELEKKTDYLAKINGDWTLHKINDTPVDKSIKAPNMLIKLSQKQISGIGGCNNYTGKITYLTSNKIKFGNIANTNRACVFKNIEPTYFKALNDANTFQIKGNNLIFYNKKGYRILSYLKGI